MCIHYLKKNKHIYNNEKIHFNERICTFEGPDYLIDNNPVITNELSNDI